MRLRTNRVLRPRRVADRQRRKEQAISVLVWSAIVIGCALIWAALGWWLFK